MKPILFATVLLALLPAGAPAEAAPSVHVRYSDLNLASDAGVRTFDRRLAAAATAVCPDADGIYDLARKLLARRCFAKTMKQVALQREAILAAYGPASKVAERPPTRRPM